jgi:Alanine racemase, N-terminal domain
MPSIHDLPTPALIVDSAALEHNLATMASALPGTRLRPHVKAHKCTELAKRQAAHGHHGFCCATVREMVGMAKAGLGTDLMLANETLDARRLAPLEARITARMRRPGRSSTRSMHSSSHVVSRMSSWRRGAPTTSRLGQRSTRARRAIREAPRGNRRLSARKELTMANRRAIEQKIEQLKQMATIGLAATEQLLGEDRQHKWSIPDRKIASSFCSPSKAV